MKRFSIIVTSLMAWSWLSLAMDDVVTPACMQPSPEEWNEETPHVKSLAQIMFTAGRELFQFNNGGILQVSKVFSNRSGSYKVEGRVLSEGTQEKNFWFDLTMVRKPKRDSDSKITYEVTYSNGEIF